MLLATRCSSCPSPELVSYAQSVGIAISCMLAALLVLGSPLFILDQLRKRELAERRHHAHNNILRMNTLALKIRSKGQGNR